MSTFFLQIKLCLAVPGFHIPLPRMLGFLQSYLHVTLATVFDANVFGKTDLPAELCLADPICPSQRL
jgi:hypothetical protein